MKIACRVCLLALLASAAIPARAEGLSLSFVFPLASLQRAEVMIEDLPDAAVDIGLTRSRLEDFVKETLEGSRVGLKVVPLYTRSTIQPIVYVVLNLSTLKSKAGTHTGYCGFIDIQVYRFF